MPKRASKVAKKIAGKRDAPCYASISSNFRCVFTDSAIQIFAFTIGLAADNP